LREVKKTGTGNVCMVSYNMKGIDFSKGIEGGENSGRCDADKPLYVAHV
jgi:hypothetical protein